MARKWKLEELCIKRELPSTCVPVKVNKIIDPKTFCVSQLRCSEDLQKLEETLGKEFCPSLYRPPRHPFLPEEEEMVAVKDYTTGQCHRGVVKNVLQTARGYVYYVFLVDHGTCLQVRSSYIRILPKHLMQLKWQAYQIELYGILPTTVEMNYEEMKLERAVTVVWTDAAMSFVSETIQRSRYACFDRKMERRNRYGDLYLPQDGGFVNLGDVLVQMEFAIKDETAFIELVNAECSYYNRLENGLPDSPESCSGPSLIQTKQRLLEEHIEKCRQEQAMLSETKRRQIEKWREESKEALLNKEEDGFSSPSRKSYSAETSMENNDKAVPKRDELLFLLEAYKKSESSPHIDNVSKEIELRSENELTHESKTVNTTALDNNTEVKQEKPVSALSLIELLHSNKKECGTQREDLSNSPKKEEIIISSPVGVKIDQSNDLLQVKLQKSKNEKSPVKATLVPAGFNLGTLNSQKKDVVSSDSNSYLVTKTKQKQSLDYPRSPQPCKTVKTVPKVTQKSVSPVSNAVHGSETSTPATTESDTATTKPPSTLLQRLLKLKELQIEGNILSQSATSEAPSSVKSNNDDNSSVTSGRHSTSSLISIRGNT